MFVQCPSAFGGSNIYSMDGEWSKRSQSTEYSSNVWDESMVSTESCYGPSCRLKFALLEYKQFKAARMIQCHVRGYLTRKCLDRQAKAATTISRWWRGFWVRRFKFASIQQHLQQQIMQYHHDMATKIQALFRGWMTRQYFQDFQGMKSLRMQYAEDMLSALYRNLYKMRKDHMLPGIYALRETDLLTKIEDLSCTFGYRFHNGRVRAAIAMKRAFINDRREEFVRSRTYSKAPYPGPYSENLPTTEFTLPKKIGPRLQRTILVYDKSMRDKHVEKVYMNYSTKRRISMNVLRESKRNRFCKDFIRRIMANKNMARKQLERKMIQIFLDDLLTAADEYNCFCKPRFTVDSLCQ
ncbi:uncharacterized protein LOC119546199 [Drosophila subpulchrella]|uniref:uncharacterized protein LOC119546199 n=1 Tax=Drosophila subpulchrella TaxID=1486046 RepID=UPI0018A18177|nr:uncharacterized protein LOC119546199 [Drosophila subpulchrella]